LFEISRAVSAIAPITRAAIEIFFASALRYFARSFAYLVSISFFFGALITIS